jgi:hypothetical protein
MRLYPKYESAVHRKATRHSPTPHQPQTACRVPRLLDRMDAFTTGMLSNTQPCMIQVCQRQVNRRVYEAIEITVPSKLNKSDAARTSPAPSITHELHPVPNEQSRLVDSTLPRRLLVLDGKPPATVKAIHDRTPFEHRKLLHRRSVHLLQAFWITLILRPCPVSKVVSETLARWRAHL